MPVEILRLSHRISRDPRLSTHVALTARAFLADKIYYSGQYDSSLENSINKVTSQFGSNFTITYTSNPIKLIQEKKKENYKIINLTMYGISLSKSIPNIKKHKKLLIIIGGEKVPPEIYELADYNTSITPQPISEVSALAIFLHEYFQGKELSAKFPNAKIVIKPSEKGKNVMKVLKLRGAKHQKKIVAMQIGDNGVEIYPEQEVFAELKEY